MNQPNTVFWNNIPLNDEDISPLSQRFKLSYALTAEVIEQLKATGTVMLSKYAGTPRERVRAMLEEVTTNPTIEPSESEPAEEEKSEAPPTPSGEPVDAFAPAPATEVQDIVSDAAVSLIQAMADTGEGHFIITNDGCCEVNPERPPEITHAYQVVAKVLKLRELAPAVDDKSSWMLGSIVASLEDYFGENFSISQVCELESQSYNTIYQRVAVYKRFKDKRYNLSYSHHQEAHYARIKKDDKENREVQNCILSKAESYDLSKKHVRALCSIAKKMDDDQVIKNIRSHDQAMDLIDAYKRNKVLYYVYDDGAWTEVSGLDGEIPEGKVVIDTKNKKAYANGESVDIQKRSK